MNSNSINHREQRFGLFGGSFNPVQNGHLLVARTAMEELELDRVFFIPAARSPFKPELELAPASTRLRLLRLALAGETRFEIDEQEIRKGGISYTIDTARFYRAKYPTARLFYIIGSDHLPTLPLWKDAEELASLVEFAVLLRPGEANIALPQPFKGAFIKGFTFSVSSTAIRERIKKGLSLKGLVPDIVAEAIQKLELYK
ncbi:MAG: nicotinate-nucleotide adenylyltransferase [Verrucomicrobiia bacterium]